MSEIGCSDFKQFHCGDLSSSPNNSDNLIAADASASANDASFMKNDQGLMMHQRSLTGCPQTGCWNPPSRRYSYPTTSS